MLKTLAILAVLTVAQAPMLSGQVPINRTQAGRGGTQATSIPNKPPRSPLRPR